MFTMKFEFDEHDVSGADNVSAALSGMRLSNVSIQESEGYVAVRTSYNAENQPTETTYHYGFARITLACENDEDSSLYSWQLDAYAYPKGEIAGSDAFHDSWCLEHPDRVMRVLQQHSFNRTDAFIVLHHERVGE